MTYIRTPKFIQRLFLFFGEFGNIPERGKTEFTIQSHDCNIGQQIQTGAALVIISGNYGIDIIFENL
jgi:hypothetical protein